MKHGIFWIPKQLWCLWQCQWLCYLFNKQDLEAECLDKCPASIGGLFFLSTSFFHLEVRQGNPAVHPLWKLAFTGLPFGCYLTCYDRASFKMDRKQYQLEGGFYVTIQTILLVEICPREFRAVALLNGLSQL